MAVRPIAAILFAAICLVLFGPFPASGQPAFASSDGPGAAHHTQVKLLLSDETARPGDTILAGVDLRMEAGWHTYWKNPGDAGSATKIEWTLPRGVSAGDIQWPLPQKIPPADVTTYGYEDEAVLVVPLTLTTNLAPGGLNLSAKVSWLECKESCIPADAVVGAKLNIGGETKPSTDATLIQLWQSKTPRTDRLFAFQVWWERPANGDTRPLIIAGSPLVAAGLPIESVDFFPDASDQFEVQPATEKIPSPAGFRLRKAVKKFSGDWPKSVSGLLVIESNHQRSGFPLQAPIGEEAPSGQSLSASLQLAAPAGSIPRTHVALRLSRRPDSQSHALCAAGHRPENPRFCQRGPQRTAPGSQTGIGVRARRARFFSGARGHCPRRPCRRASRRLGDAVQQSGVRRLSHHTGFARRAEPVWRL